eukprot:COSAG02_NODE_32898_length_508_cov_2.139364_1_plen_45_part_10
MVGTGGTRARVAGGGGRLTASVRGRRQAWAPLMRLFGGGTQEPGT